MAKVTHLTLDERGGLSGKRIHLREISDDADAPLETVGQDLRAARLRRGDELGSVSRVLRIRKDHLEAIEEDRLEGLPGRTYAIGFVRSYADYLGLDPVECVERFKSEIAGRSDSSPHVGMAPPETGASRLPHGWMVMAVVVVAVVVYGAYHLARSADMLSTQTVAPVPAQIAPAQPAPQAHVAPKIQVPAPQVATKPAAEASTAISAPQAAPTPPGSSAATTAAGAPASAPAPAAPANTQVASLPPGQIFGAQNQHVRVVLHARALTHILVQGPRGQVYINRVLHPGDLYRVPNLVGLLLTTPDGGAVAVELDGQDMGAAGESGQMTEALSLDPQAIVDRTNGGTAQ